MDDSRSLPVRKYVSKDGIASKRRTLRLIATAGVVTPGFLTGSRGAESGWIKLVVRSVVLPAHAQVSQPRPRPPAITGDIRVTSILWQQTASNDPEILVDEYVDIQNFDSVAIDITKWTLGDTGDNLSMTFPERVLQPGESCRIYVHAPPGIQTCEYTFGRTSPGAPGNYVFNNSGDSANLADASGTVIDTCSYGGSDPSPYICP